MNMDLVRYESIYHKIKSVKYLESKIKSLIAYGTNLQMYAALVLCKDSGRC